MNEIFDIENIDNLIDFLQSSEQSKTYQFLVDEFKNLTEYKNANEWNKLVKVCEALSIIGWGELERVDAICFTTMNVWKTELRNKEKKLRFLSAGWTKSKNGFTYSNPSYYFSPDIPEKESIDWQQYPKSEIETINVLALLDQRNKQKVNPITIGGVFSLKSKIESNTLFPLLLELRKIMDENLNTERYGVSIEKISIRYNTAKPNEKTESCFLNGTYYPKTKEYKAEVFFGEEYAIATETKRKLIIEKLLLLTLDDIKRKCHTHKLNYNIDLLIDELKNETSSWVN